MILPAAWLVAAALAPAASAKEECVPPVFYTSLPRDRDYYYGVARDADTDKARDAAIRNLGKQVGGDVEGWSQEQIDAVAGPCRDKWEVAAGISRLLPKSSLLAGWEQDDFARCAGFSYVLVRIEKERVARFVRGSGDFKRDLVESLTRRLEKVEAGVEELNRRLERLEKGLGGLPADGSDPEAGRVRAIVTEARAQLRSGGSPAQVEQKLVTAEDAYSKLEERMKGYQRSRDEAEAARLAAVKAASAPELRKALAAIDAGNWGFETAGRAIGIYNDAKDYDGLRRFSRGLLARPDTAKLGGREDFVAYMGIVADLSLKDDKAFLADGEEFLKKYPRSDLFDAVKAQLDGKIALSRLTQTPEPAPCVKR